MNGRILKLESMHFGIPSGLSADVNRKCDEWLRKRGLVTDFKSFDFNPRRSPRSRKK